MKSFLISIILLSAIIIGVVFNSIYVNSITSEMLTLIDKLPDAPDKNDISMLSDLQETWQKNFNFINLTINSDYTHEITVSLNALSSYIETESKTEYSAARAKLRDSVLRLQKNESFSICNIF